MSANRLLLVALVGLLAWGGPARGDDLPGDALKQLEKYEQEAAAIQKKADAEIQAKKEKLIKELKALQDAYCKDGKLDEAVAIRDKIRLLRRGALEVRPDPGYLASYRDQVGKSFVFEVTGKAVGTIWGSGIYTDDSLLSVVAVHAGVLRDGQKGFVKVTILKYEGTYEGTNRNGVTSNPFGVYPGSSYRVEAVKD